VVVYRGSGVINFAHGAIGMVGAYAFWELHDSRRWSFLPAFALSVGLAAATGFVAYQLVMRPLQEASQLARLLGTLGLLITIQAGISLRYRQQLLIVDPSLPTSTMKVAGAVVGVDRVMLFAIGSVLTVVLFGFYRWTGFGRSTAAVAEDPEGAAMLGYSARRIGSANWAIGAALGGTAGILLAPITGLQVTQLTGLIVPVLAAAIIGNMVSFPITFAAGLGLGVMQAEISRYVKTPGASLAYPFIVVIAVLLLRGTSVPTREHIQARMPRAGTGRLRPIPIVVALLLATVVITTAPVDWVDGLTVTLIITIILLSFVVVTGYAGQLSLAQFTMAGLGAYVAGRLASAHELPFGLALVIAVAAAVPIGVVIGLPAVRTRGINLAIATLALSVAVEALIFNRSSLTGGSVGTQIAPPTLFGIDMDSITHPRNYAIMVVGFLALATMAVANLRRGRSGRRLLAIRSNERGAAALGVAVATSKLCAFAIGAAIAALGGVLLSFRDTNILYSTYGSFTSITVVGLAVIGGVGYVIGPLVGGLLQVGGIGTKIGGLLGDDVQRYLPLLGGLALLLTVVLQPDGVIPSLVEQLRSVRRSLSRGRRPVSTGSTSLDPNASGSGRSSGGVDDHAVRTILPVEAQPVQPRTLRVHELTVDFGAARALDGISFEIGPGEVLGLIGPNGAGKTTLIDAVTGFVSPSRGSVVLGGAEVTRLAPHRRSRHGVGRSFQSLELFEDLTVLENLLVASEQRSRGWTWITDFVRPSRARLTSETMMVAETFGLTAHLDRLPTDLSYGQRRLLSIARAVAAEPSAILLDEPAAGLSSVETRELGEVIRYLADVRRMAVLLVEHDIDIVMRTCDRITVLDFGHEISTGSPSEVRSDERVIRAYLGVDDSTRSSDEHGRAAVEASHVAR
jgi:ABC-type branched-subunit amino acid transport system ATPase component/ABC-type branched-subunit amino acid transport system permease subunit